MSRKKPSVVRVCMAKRVATAWLETHAQPEHRITVYAAADALRNLPSLLRAFRDHKTRLAGLGEFPGDLDDLGISTGFDQMTLWSKNREGMIELDKWLRKKGCETTGIW
jgi:hypothetical protein